MQVPVAPRKQLRFANAGNAIVGNAPGSFQRRSGIAIDRSRDSLAKLLHERESYTGIGSYR